MLIIPAIDLKEGRCVRLRQGRKEEETVYASDPVAVALHWQAAGAQLLHVVDLDGAWAGEPANLDLIQRLAGVLEIPVEVGGGIRDSRTARRYLEGGIDRVILGTAAVADPELVARCCEDFPGRILLGLDGREGYLATHGWDQTSAVRVLEAAQQFEGMGLRAFIYTDIQRDGMLTGPNVAAIEELARSTRVPVIASGGVARWEDIERLLPLGPIGVEGIIIGKALYSGALNFREVWERVCHVGQEDHPLPGCEGWQGRQGD
ncbi:MAG: 1-(5-phosphoribosyl)-5-[(5-phosphoribosylamino)methylideneamino]imidazole-4-carboxamide isomerase [Candidatus Tectomicrobia bacterium]|uniref:1-(5-phosphoribosyl)-5-[(5-phosphoribosylamino)methylideneamino] imidazole-4-carboxamide isomerase n=1 Tax=Tectimicrobiota bacterium TaxID=2528274 RepID=A0A932CMV2_UNCTE|nr:1-(5-phosphoribosyl)-5-[(5-phosphoribosylamino)methylideneamino]imidazole-4-carboxamide isomerase [Candidatus Tectomicrobia bacterium]